MPNRLHDDRSTWVLDLRRHGNGNSPDGLHLTNATAYGEADGYTVSAQRRSRDGLLGLCVRLTAPDGRELNLVGYLDHVASNAKGPTSTLLSPAVAYAFRDRRTPEQNALCIERIELVIQAGHRCLEDGITGVIAASLVHSAAHGIDPETVRTWKRVLCTRTASTRSSTSASAPARYDHRVETRDIVTLIKAGFTPDTAREWFSDNDSIRVPNTSEVSRRDTFRQHGWTAYQYRRFNALVGTSTTTSWAKLGPRCAALALAADMTPAEVVTLIRRGQWDEDRVRMLAALNNHPYRSALIFFADSIPAPQGEVSRP